jgi:DegV family protein with EDD domain
LSNSVSTHLDGDDFANALVSGIHRVVDEQDLLNRINVFPVADGDTGTNLSLSLGSALPILTRPGEKHLGTLLAAFADALLDGSRGNSGAIVAQFFQGMSDSAGELNRFTPYTFGNAVTLGGEYAHDALSNPQEGTILSVIAAFANSVRRQAGKGGESDFRPVIDEGLGRVEKALAKTTGQLDVLKKAGVVDAGAKGFAILLSGMAEFILHGRVAPAPDLSLLFSEEMSFDTSADGEESDYRFCTECIVTGSDIDRRKLREALDELGDSLVLAGTKRKAKIHIHVDEPEKVFDVARNYGELSAEKADDMHRQHVSSHNDARRFAVITDSAADIADDDMERLDIHMVPCRIQFGDRGYLDKVSISTEEFFEELATNPNHPTTSQPSPGDFRRQYQFLASHFADVISINVTSRASGTFQAAESAAERVNAPGRIHVIDSRNASVGQGLLAVYAAECSKAGVAADVTIDAVASLIPETLTYALVKDFRYAVLGGRVPAWVKSIADLFRLTPVIRTVPDGRVATGGFLLGRSNRLPKFARHIAKHSANNSPLIVAIGHALCREDAVELARLLRAEIPNIERLITTDLGTALGVHGGPGTMIVSTQPHRPIPGNSD